MKKFLGEMHAEDFYNVKIRSEKELKAEAQVKTELAEKGLAIDHKLLRQYYYNTEYDQQIEDKKIQDQLVFTRQSGGPKDRRQHLRRFRTATALERGACAREKRLQG